jgi:hypothetical protein
MNYSILQQLFNSTFRFNETNQLASTHTNVYYFGFSSKPAAQNNINTDGLLSDNIAENSDFIYTVFTPLKQSENNRVILLLHGLNERSWNKYLTWGEYLCNKTGKPVILFPIAFHMNRSPQAWTNPRLLQAVFEMRKKDTLNDRTLSFSNLALSQRISEDPARFYHSGRQSLNDINFLANEIRTGRHPLFREGTGIDIFAYSIGAFLSQVALMSDQNGVFSDSRLFMFCGGSIFSEMDGESRSIMDKTAFECLMNYYKKDFEQNIQPDSDTDKVYQSFCSMISPDHLKDERIGFFSKARERIRGISLKRDKVIPYKGIVSALGDENSGSQITLLDFPYEYTHENPFPLNNKKIENEVNASFSEIFGSAAAFLA